MAESEIPEAHFNTSFIGHEITALSVEFRARKKCTRGRNDMKGFFSCRISLAPFSIFSLFIHSYSAPCRDVSVCDCDITGIDTPVTLSIRAQLSVFYDGPRGVSDGIIARPPKPLRWRIKEFISRPPRWGWGKSKLPPPRSLFIG